MRPIFEEGQTAKAKAKNLTLTFERFDKMSKYLPQNEVNSFDARVKAAYENGSMLRPTIDVANDVVGATHRFQKQGKGMATKRQSQTDVIPMNVNNGNATATLEDWNAPEYTSIFDQQKVNYNEREKLAVTIANAIGRREDQLILDAFDAASTTLTVSTDVGGSGTGLNTAKCRRARRLMKQKGVSLKKGEAHAVISANGMEELLGDDDANTADKNMIKALYDGEIEHWLGFEFHEMEDRDEGGLPIASNVRTSYFYHKDSTGLAVGINFRTEVNYIPTKTSWLSNGLMSAGAVVIDALGLVEVSTTETV